MLTQETSTQSDIRRSLIQEIGQTSDYVLSEVLDFLLFVRSKHQQDPLHTHTDSDEDLEDIADAKAALATVKSEGAISWETLKSEIGL